MAKKHILKAKESYTPAVKETSRYLGISETAFLNMFRIIKVKEYDFGRYIATISAVQLLAENKVLLVNGCYESRLENLAKEGKISIRENGKLTFVFDPEETLYMSKIPSLSKLVQKRYHVEDLSNMGLREIKE
jgi:hypothetical protein